MTDATTIGTRLKHFRKEAGFSQFEIETELNMSVGALSRIESGKTNPTKETLDKISDAIGLDFYTRSYIYGATATPASKKELRDVTQYIEEFFSDPTVIAYIVDERERLITYSAGLGALVEERLASEIAQFPERTTIQIVLNSPHVFDLENSANFLRDQLALYKIKAGFMFDDYYYLETIKDIQKHQEACIVWEELADVTVRDISTAQTRTVPWIFNGATHEIQFVPEKVPGFSRFELRTYEVTNKLMGTLVTI